MAAGNTPLTAADAYALNLWRQNGLGDHPTMNEIEPVAKALLAEDPMDGASMVLGRKIRSEDTEICRLLLGTPGEMFILLLLRHDLDL